MTLPPDPPPDVTKTVPIASHPKTSRGGGPTSLERNLEITVNGLIGAYDLSGNAALQTHIAQVLSRVGVELMEVPSGTAFDPSAYEAVSTVATDDPQRVQRVVETLRPGWRRTDGILRSPQVSVWVADPQLSSQGQGS